MKNFFFTACICSLLSIFTGCLPFSREELLVNGDLDPVNKEEGLNGDEVTELLIMKTEGNVFQNSEKIAGESHSSATKKPEWTTVNKSGQKLVILENLSRFPQYCKIMTSDRKKIKRVKIPRESSKGVYITQTADEKLIMEWKLGEKVWEDKCVEFLRGQPTDEIDGIACYASSTTQLF